ncbi:hypothetical protein [Fictibacillus sp. NRS-1165]|uniref:hypothetical protein n=1 Tax=Fictibacillus sp. NRS-1165 TaxID=3144463 RepID=UPI003D23C5FB
MIRALTVSSVNLQLMSDDEVDEILESYAAFLGSIQDEFMTQNVPQPMNLKSYIKAQQEILDQDDDVLYFQRLLLEDHIKYLNNIETSSEIIKRHRYIVISQQIEELNEKGYEDALRLIETQTEDFINGLKEVSLKVEVASDIEVVRLFHTFFDYQSAQNAPIKDTDVPQLIIGGKSYEIEIA